MTVTVTLEDDEARAIAIDGTGPKHQSGRDKILAALNSPQPDMTGEPPKLNGLEEGPLSRQDLNPDEITALVAWLEKTDAPQAYVTSMPGMTLDPLSTGHAKLVWEQRAEAARQALAGPPRDPEDIAKDRAVVDRLRLEG